MSESELEKGATPPQPEETEGSEAQAEAPERAPIDETAAPAETVNELAAEQDPQAAADLSAEAGGDAPQAEPESAAEADEEGGAGEQEPAPEGDRVEAEEAATDAVEEPEDGGEAAEAATGEDAVEEPEEGGEAAEDEPSDAAPESAEAAADAEADEALEDDAQDEAEAAPAAEVDAVPDAGSEEEPSAEAAPEASQAEPADAAPHAANDDGSAEAEAGPRRKRGEAPDPDPDFEEVQAATIDQQVDDDSEPFEKLAAKAKRLKPERIRTILESLLFVTDKPLSEEALRDATGIPVPVVREQLEKLQGGYRDGVRGIVLHEVSGGWQFRTDPTNSEYVRRFLKVKPQRLTRAALETLAIIAYRQPVTRPEVEDIRAVDSGAVIKALLERRLIKIIGKRDEPGRPLLYGTTPEFLEFFNLRDLGSLPTLREFHELSEENREIVEKETGEAEEPKRGTDTIVEDLKDNTFEEKLAETTAEADAALADLELALADSDEKAKETARMLNPQQPAKPEGDEEAAED